MSRKWTGMVIISLLVAIAAVAPANGATFEGPERLVTPAHATDHVLVKLDPTARANEVLGRSARGVFGRWHSQPVPMGRSAGETVEELLGRPGVDIAELDYQVQVDPVSAPVALGHSGSLAVDDPYLSYQWHFPAIQLAEAWPESTGAGVVVAVVDSGVSRDGEDLLCRSFLAPYNAITETAGTTAATDDYGHGTHVAGTIAECTDNGVGVAGVAFDASLMPVKVLDDTGSGLISWIARGVDWARTHGADVINLSLGCLGCSSSLMDEAIESAADEGIVIVAASGNDGANVVSYPASHPDVIAVGATELNNQRAPYSNRGSALDVVAPGGNTGKDANGDGFGDGVLQETFVGSTWGYYFFQGTSMATPHVSGAAALLKSIEPGLDGASVASILEATALDLGAAGFDSSYGYGLIQIHDAIQFLSEPDSTSPVWPAGANIASEVVGKGKVQLEWPDANDDRAVVGYRIYRDGSLVKTTTASQTWTTVSGLESLTKYRFSVRAEDLAGNLSSPLATEITTPDVSPPVWGSSAEFSVKTYGETGLTLRWSAAVDDAGVVEYRLRLVDTTGLLTSSRQAKVTGLDPGSPYRFEVLARDAAGNWSDPLAATVRTARAFEDTPGTTFFDDIRWMSGEDITRGCNPPVNDRYCPNDPVTRGQMAAFVVRLLGLKANDHPDFLDVDPTSTFSGDIGRLATAGITRGCNPPDNDRFCPDDPVTRAQMAAFIVRMEILTENANPDYVDVPATSTFAADIGKLATAGITRGCNPPENDRFCPDDPVTRGELAAFFHRAEG